MDSKSQQIFDNIVKKDVSSLTVGETIFLKARRGYLSLAQADKFKDILVDRGVKITEDKIPYKELWKRIKILGLKAKVGTTRETLEKMISDATQ